MKKNIALAAALLFLVVLVPTLSAQYNKGLVVEKMRSNGALFGQVNAAVNSGDFYAAARGLMGLAENSKALEATDPPKGSKAEWAKLYGELVQAAFRGIGACGNQDSAALKAEVAKIGALMKDGHAKFR